MVITLLLIIMIMLLLLRNKPPQNTQTSSIPFITPIYFTKTAYPFPRLGYPIRPFTPYHRPPIRKR